MIINRIGAQFYYDGITYKIGSKVYTERKELLEMNRTSTVSQLNRKVQYTRATQRGVPLR